MSDAPITIVSTSRDGAMFSPESMQELEDQLAALTPEDFKEKETAPTPEPDVPAEDSPVEEPPTEEVTGEQAEEPAEEPEEDSASMEAERHRIELEQMRARYDLQQAHSSRLAGQIGYLEKQLQQALVSRSSEPSYEPEADADASFSAALARDVSEIKSELTQAKVSQAIALGSVALDDTEGRELRDEIIAVAANYKDQMEAIFSMTDPGLARQSSEALTRCILADAKETRWQKRHSALEERKAATVRESVLKKKAATVSGSGSVPPPPQRPKALTDLSADEADQWLRENVSPL